MPYYWLNSIDLEDGAVVNPGTWFRIKRTTPLDIWYALEVVYENIRSESFSNLPSRQKSLFVFVDKSKAIDYQHNYRQSDIVYEVELIGSENKCVLDMSIVRPDLPIPSMYEEQARRYWESANRDDHTLSELVYDGRIKVVSKII